MNYNRNINITFIPYIGLALFFIYSILPYHRFFNGFHGIIFHVIVFCASTVWFLLTKDFTLNISFKFNKIDFAFSVLLILISIFMTYSNLCNSIVWKGDESFHILRSLALNCDLVKIKYLIFIYYIFIIFFLISYKIFSKLFCKRKLNFYVLTFYIISSLLLLYFLRSDFTTSMKYFPRYQPVFMFFENIFANNLFGTLFSESAHRLSSYIPWLINGFIIYMISRSKQISQFSSFLIGVYILSLPISRHYATIVYIDSLLITLIFIGVYLWINLQNKNNSLYSYSMIISIYSLIKITVLPYLISVFIIFSIYMLKNKSLKIKNAIILFCIIFLPSIPQIYVRTIGRVQDIPQNLYYHFIDFAIWKGLFKSYIDQYTVIFLMLFLFGVFACVIKHNKRLLYFLFINIIFFLFFMMRIDRVWIGVGRYNYYFLPFFTMIVICFFQCLCGKEKNNVIKLLTNGVIILFVFYNLSFDIFNPKKMKKNWISPFSNPIETYYPFNKSIKYIKNKVRDDELICVEGSGYPYFLYFYLMKYNVPTSNIIQKRKVRNLEESLCFARQNKARVLLYMYTKNPELLPKKNAKRFYFHNKAIDIFIFKKGTE